MQTKQRIFYYDILRAYAIIGVIICHVLHFFGPLNTQFEIISQLTFHNLGRIGVPLFLMISGALLLNRDYPNLNYFLKRRFARIIYPFIFWIIIIALVYAYYKMNASFIWSIVIGNTSVTWYFWTLIGIYLAIPLINAFIKEYGEEGCKYFLTIWLITIILNTMHSYPLFTNFNLDYFAGYIGYPVLGYYLSNKEFKLENKKMCIIGVMIFLISLIIFDYYTSNYELTTLSFTYQNIMIVSMAIGFFILIKYLDKLGKFNSIKENFIGKAIISLSVCSYGMYFSHVIVVKILSYHNPGSNVLFPLMFVLIVFLSWLLPYILSKIPYVKNVCGV